MMSENLRTENIIQDYILKHGFMPLDVYMQICMQHDDFGYYRIANPIGTQGDFITAPEISQIFGELIGVFIDFHHAQIFPKGYQICELGAGRGVLARDYLRVLKQKPSGIFFLETNKHLKEHQLLNVPNAQHIDSLKALPSVPTVFLANEFFDALPIKAFKLCGSQQAEIIIVLDEEQNLKFDYASFIKNTQNQYHGYYETSPNSLDFCKQISDFIKTNQGIFLCCDYGYDTPLYKMTFRGFLNHTVTNGLQKPFVEDLTADVDFTQIMDFFYDNNHCVYNLMTQANFLKALYIDKRLHQLLRNISDNDMRQQLILGVQKLLLPNEMGERFKFLLVTDSKQEYYPFLDFYKPIP